MGSVFCPCSEPPGAVDKVPLTLHDPSLRHRLEDLYFCNTCRSIKCYRCVDLEHGSKFCPSCWRSFDHKVRYCQRHCFRCPSCRSRLRVKADSNSEDPKTSKSFRFSCANCKWTYTTGTLTKPQPLHDIIREKRSTALGRRFNELKTYYENLYETVHISEARHRTRLIGRYSSLELAHVVERRQLPEIGVIREQKVEEPELPLFQELCCKSSVRCKSCREILVQPSPEPSSSSFETLSMAMSRLPVLECRAFRGGSFSEFLKLGSHAQYTRQADTESPQQAQGGGVGNEAVCAFGASAVAHNCCSGRVQTQQRQPGDGIHGGIVGSKFLLFDDHRAAGGDQGVDPAVEGAVKDAVGVHGASAAFEGHPHDEVEDCGNDQEEDDNVVAAEKHVCKKPAQQSARDRPNIDHGDKEIRLTRGEPVFDAHERKERRRHENRAFGKDTAQNAEQELAVIAQCLEVERLGEIVDHGVLSGHLLGLDHSSFLDQKNGDRQTHKRDQSQQAHGPREPKSHVRLSQHGGDDQAAYTAAVAGEGHCGGSFPGWKVLRDSTHQGRGENSRGNADTGERENALVHLGAVGEPEQRAGHHDGAGDKRQASPVGVEICAAENHADLQESSVDGEDPRDGGRGHARQLVLEQLGLDHTDRVG
ncbi:hypothetical protein KL948_003479 [Ogataea haglerorum]|nr:hypothetical protein KL948_003479 [Ogataea haglerorum]